LAHTPKLAAERTGQPDEVGAVQAVAGRLLGHGVVRAALALDPAVGGLVAPVLTLRTRSRPRPSSATTARVACPLGRVGVPRGVAAGEAGLDAGIVVGRRHEDARADVAGLDAVGPRHPGGGDEQRPSPGSMTTSLTVTTFGRARRAPTDTAQRQPG
jgi:hypothetical protein